MSLGEPPPFVQYNQPDPRVASLEARLDQIEKQFNQERNQQQGNFWFLQARLATLEKGGLDKELTESLKVMVDQLYAELDGIEDLKEKVEEIAELCDKSGTELGKQIVAVIDREPEHD